MKNTEKKIILKNNNMFFWSKLKFSVSKWVPELVTWSYKNNKNILILNKL